MTNTGGRQSSSRADSISLAGAVAMGTGVMIGAGILALTGQMAELAGELYPFAFAAAAVVAAFSAYSYVKLAQSYPSAGGIAMFLKMAYGKTGTTGAFSLLMLFSMIINESLVARTFGTYALQPFDTPSDSWLIPILGVALLLFAFLINILGNRFIETTSLITALVKIGGLLVFGFGILWFSGFSFTGVSTQPAKTSLDGFLGAVALGLLAYKGFTTITNSGDEISDPHRNIGRAIIISLALCLVLYLLASLAVGAELSVDQIVAAKNYALAQAARPVFGDYGLYFTVAFAIVATISGVMASMFAVSRMLAMLTEMKLVPHSHFGMPGPIQRHTLVYTLVIAMALTVFFDLSRIASLGAVFYIVMDIAIHWGLLRHLRDEVDARLWIPISAIVLDLLVLGAFLLVKARNDMLIIYAAVAGLLLIFVGEMLFVRARRSG